MAKPTAKWRDVRLRLLVFNMPKDYKDMWGVSGIYFLIHKGEIEYIGRSTNVGNRLTSHHIFDRNYHDEVWIYPVPYEDRLIHHFYEYDLIHELRPPRNTHGL